MKLDSEFIKQIQSVSRTAGGYLTVELYDKNRGVYHLGIHLRKN